MRSLHHCIISENLKRCAWIAAALFVALGGGSSLSKAWAQTPPGNCPAANPSDSVSDDAALQACLNQGGTVLLVSGEPGYSLATGLIINQSNTTLTSADPANKAKLMADPNLNAPMLTVSGSPANWSISHLVFDGNRDLRTLKANCSGYRIFGSILQPRGSGFTIHHNELRHALCGSAMELSGQGFEIYNNIIEDNGWDQTTYAPEPWSDGITVLSCDNGYVHDNTLKDNTDIDIVVGGGVACRIQDNTITHQNRYGFGGLTAGWFYGGVEVTPFANSTTAYHSRAMYSGNTISSATNKLAFGLMVGHHPWDINKTVTLDGTQVTGNTVTGAVVNLAVDGVESGMILGNVVSSPQGNDGFSNCSLSANYTVGHVTSVSLQDGWTRKEFSGGGCTSVADPYASIAYPTHNSTVSGLTKILGTVASDVPIVGVQFKVDGANLWVEDTVAPYAADWDTTIASNAAHTLSATARDSAGTLKTISINVSVDNSGANLDMPPTAPTLTANAADSNQVNLSWSIATDDIGVAGYQIERCQGANCINFVQIAAPMTISYIDTAVTSNTVYRYRVLAVDTAGHPSNYSNITDVTTLSLLSIVKVGAGIGSVTSSPAGITCGADCTEAYPAGTVVTLTPTPSSGSLFAGWTGHVDCADNQVLMDSNKTCTATFVLDQSSPSPVAWYSMDAPTGKGLNGPLDTGTDDLGGVNVANLKALWHFDGSGVDGSGNGNTATAVNGATFSGAGKRQQGVVLDGVNDYVTKSANASLNSATFTVEVWFKPNTLRVQGIASKGTGSQFRWRIFMASTTGTIEFDAVPGEIGNLQSVTNAVAGQWMHCASVYDSITQTAQLYINGVLERTVTGLTNMGGASNNAIYLGSDGLAAFFAGTIDETAIYNVALTSSQILDHYRRGVVEDKTTNDPNSFEANDGDTFGPISVPGPTNLNEALSFDGVDDYLAVPHSLSLDVTWNFTIAYWIKMSGSTSRMIVEKGTSGTGYSSQANSGISLAFWSGGTLKEMYSNSPFNDGEWHHFAGVYDGTEIRIYKDGVLDTSGAFSGPVDTNMNPLVMGARGGTTLFFNGSIDEAKIFNRALTAAEILTEAGGSPSIRTLTVSRIGSGSGTVTSSPTGINCGVTCSADFNPGTVVTLTATPAAGSDFFTWGGACTGTSSTCTVTMDTTQSVSATFELQPSSEPIAWYRLDEGSGTVTSDSSVSANTGYLAATNRLLNPSFESPASGAPSNWTIVGAGTSSNVDSSVQRDGLRSMKLVFNGTAVAYGRQQAVTVISGAQYVLRGWLKNSLTDTYKHLQCDVYGAGIDSPGIQLFTTGDWTFRTEVVTIPIGTSTVYIRCFADGTPSGTGWIDGLSFTAVSAMPTWTTAGRFSNALVFDGVDDHVNVPHNPSINIIGSFTIEYWIKMTGTTSRMAIEKGSGNGYYSYAPSTITLAFLSGGALKELYSNSTFNDGEWHHFTGVYDGTQIRIYKDGTLDASGAFSGPVDTNTSPLFIGARGGSALFFGGSLDEVKIFNRALTAAEVCTEAARTWNGNSCQ